MASQKSCNKLTSLKSKASFELPLLLQNRTELHTTYHKSRILHLVLVLVHFLFYKKFGVIFTVVRLQTSVYVKRVCVYQAIAGGQQWSPVVVGTDSQPPCVSFALGPGKTAGALHCPGNTQH